MTFDELLDAAFLDHHNDHCSCEMCVDTQVWLDMAHVVGEDDWWAYF